MRCLACEAPITRVVETRQVDDTIRRCRTCGCGARWYTVERAERATLTTRAPPETALSLPISSPPLAHIKPSPSPVLAQLSPEDLSCISSSPLIPDRITSKLTKENYNSMGGAANLFVGVLGLFCRAWEERYGRPYRPTGADRNQLGRSLNDLHPEDLPEIPGAFQNYLADLSPWVAQSHRHSLMCFCTSGGFNKYRVSAPMLSAREARGVESGRQFVNGEGNHAGKR